MTYDRNGRSTPPAAALGPPGGASHVPVVPPPAAERSDLAAVRQAVPQFVGRAEDLEHMRRELSAPVALGGAFIVSIAGVGGVGKTSLLNQFLRQRVPTAIYVTADDRDRLTDAVALPRVLAQRLAAVLGAASHCARALAGPQRPPEGGAGPEGRPPEVSPEAPAVGAAGAAAEPTGGAAVDPVAALTDALIRDVNAAGAAGRSVVLVLDTYEGIRHVAGPWLLDTLLGGHLTPITGDLRLIISGREPLQRTDPRWLRDWDNSGRAILNVDLEPFSPAETAAYLGEASSGAAASGSAGEAPERGPPAEDVHAAHRMTGGLPVWLALWRQAWRRGGATSGAAPDMAAAEHVQMVVDRLLMWWQDPAQLRWVRTAWVPRWFNLEVLRVLVGAEAEAAFEWLTRQAAIVRGDRGRWQFHEVVRTALRQEALQRAPTELAALHDRLAEYWRGATSGPAPGPQGRGGRAAQEAIYHQLLGTDPGGGAAALCRAYVGGLAAADPALAEVVAAGGEARGHQWRGAGAALGLPAVAAVEAHWAALQAGDTTAAAAAWERLLALDAWPAAARALLLGERGDPRGGAADPAAPRAGLPARGTGVRQAPGTRVRPAWWQRRWWPGLGGVLASGRRALTPEERRHAEALVEYGDTLRLSGNYGAALVPLTAVVALDPDNPHARASRGETLRALGRTAEAIEDLSAATRLRPHEPLVWAARATAYLSAGAPAKALADAQRAVELDGRNAWALAVRGLARRQVVGAATPDAVADVRRALEFDPDLEWARTALAEWEASAADRPGPGVRQGVHEA